MWSEEVSVGGYVLVFSRNVHYEMIKRFIRSVNEKVTNFWTIRNFLRVITKLNVRRFKTVLISKVVHNQSVE